MASVPSQQIILLTEIRDQLNDIMEAIPNRRGRVLETMLATIGAEVARRNTVNVLPWQNAKSMGEVTTLIEDYIDEINGV